MTNNIQDDMQKEPQPSIDPSSTSTGSGITFNPPQENIYSDVTHNPDEVSTESSPPSAKKILIVEDELPLLNALSKKLTNAGYQVIAAENGKQGLENASKNQPDLILTDIIMPDMDGFNMIKNIRESEWGKSTPIILLTNLNNPEDVATALQYNVPDYFVKSDINLEELLLKVKEKFNQV